MPDEPEAPPPGPEPLAAILAELQAITDGNVALILRNTDSARASWLLWEGTGDVKRLADAVRSTYVGVSNTAFFLARAIPNIIRAFNALPMPLEVPEVYDFEKWVADLKEKSTPEAKALAGDVFKALDVLIGAWHE